MFLIHCTYLLCDIYQYCHYRPVVISMDDCVDYQADFVLATLMGGISPSQPSTSEAASDRQSQVQAHKDGHHIANGPNSHSADIDQYDQSHLEDSVCIKHSHSTWTRPFTGAEERKRLSSKRAQDFANTDFPSGSQFNNARKRYPRSPAFKSSSTTHVPPPPTDTDYMDIDPSLPQTSVVENKDRDSRRVSASGTTTENVMDALFGAENFSRAAEKGSMLELDHKERERAYNYSKRKTSLQCKDTHYDEERVTSGITELSDREGDKFPDNFPFEGKYL